MDLEQRLEQLERSNRRMKRIGAFVLLTAAVVLLSGQAKGKDRQHLEVGSLTLKDKDGKTRAYLGTGADAPGLLLLDRDGKKLLVDADGSPFLALYDKDEKPRAVLRLFADGSPGLFLRDKDSKTRAALTAGADGTALRLIDKDGKTRAMFGVDSDGSPSLDLLDKDEKMRALLAVGAEGSPALDLFDAKGDVIWQAPR